MKEIATTRSIYRKIFQILLKGYLWGLGFSLAFLSSSAVFMLFFMGWTPDDQILSDVWKADLIQGEISKKENELKIPFRMKNNSKYGLSSFEFEVELYDATGNFLDQLNVRTDDKFEPGEEENFLITINSDEIDHYEKVSDAEVSFVYAYVISNR